MKKTKLILVEVIIFTIGFIIWFSVYNPTFQQKYELYDINKGSHYIVELKGKGNAIKQKKVDFARVYVDTGTNLVESDTLLPKHYNLDSIEGLSVWDAHDTLEIKYMVEIDLYRINTAKMLRAFTMGFRETDYIKDKEMLDFFDSLEELPDYDENRPVDFAALSKNLKDAGFKEIDDDQIVKDGKKYF